MTKKYIVEHQHTAGGDWTVHSEHASYRAASEAAEQVSGVIIGDVEAWMEAVDRHGCLMSFEEWTCQDDPFDWSDMGPPDAETEPDGPTHEWFDMRLLFRLRLRCKEYIRLCDEQGEGSEAAAAKRLEVRSLLRDIDDSRTTS